MDAESEKEANEYEFGRGLWVYPSEKAMREARDRARQPALVLPDEP